MKVYTDIEQSKKLAEILPLDSADMCYGIDDDTLKYIKIPWLIPYHKYTAKEFYIPCWSLAALLDIIPSNLGSSKLTIEKDDLEPLKYRLNYHDTWEIEDDIQTKYYDDLVDACYEMIINLYN